MLKILNALCLAIRPHIHNLQIIWFSNFMGLSIKSPIASTYYISTCCQKDSKKVWIDIILSMRLFSKKKLWINGSEILLNVEQFVCAYFLYAFWNVTCIQFFHIMLFYIGRMPSGMQCRLYLYRNMWKFLCLIR